MRQLGTTKAVGVRNQAGAISVGCSGRRALPVGRAVLPDRHAGGPEHHLNAVNLSDATNEHCDELDAAGAYQFVVSTTRPFTLDATAQCASSPTSIAGWTT